MYFSYGSQPPSPFHMALSCVLSAESKAASHKESVPGGVPTLPPRATHLVQIDKLVLLRIPSGNHHLGDEAAHILAVAQCQVGLGDLASLPPPAGHEELRDFSGSDVGSDRDAAHLGAGAGTGDGANEGVHCAAGVVDVEGLGRRGSSASVL